MFDDTEMDMSGAFCKPTAAPGPPVAPMSPGPAPLSATDTVTSVWFGLVNLLRCGWAFCPSHFAPTVKWGPPRNAKLNKH